MENGPGPEINCINCNAACCRAGNRYQLGSTEAEVMGLDSDDIVIHSFDLMDNRPDTYEIETDCINLVEEPNHEPEAPQYQCGLHNTDKKPTCCKFIQPGGSYCLHARRMAGYYDNPYTKTLEPLAPAIIPIDGIS